jgi:hypothetical protein
MAGSPSKFSSKIATICVLIPLLAIAWYAAPLVLPMWLWQNVKWEEMSRTLAIPETTLRQQVKVIFRHAPRGDKDPLPWQLVTTEPAREEEDHILVRAVIISDRTGEPVSGLSLGSGNFRDRYFTAMAWRFPAGSIPGLNPKRPVVVFDGFSLEKPDTSKCMFWESELREATWTTTDEDVEDGWVAPDKP